MKKLSLILSVVLMTAMYVTSCGRIPEETIKSEETVKSVKSEEIVRPVEVTIGKQVWMTQNLNVDKFRNGDLIPEAKTEGEWKAYGQAGEAAWCYYNNYSQNGEKFGKLYNWYAVNDARGLAPKGWHIPSDTELTALADYLGGKEKAGAKMKSKEGWNDNGNGTNSSGFSGLPGGARDASGRFYRIGELGYWWSCSEGTTVEVWSRTLFYSIGDLGRGNQDKRIGLSVRCLRD